jgi:DNA-binding NarL/FixJ family response regulator
MVKILIAEQSYLVRKGLLHIISQFQEVTHSEVIGSQHGLTEVLAHFSPDILIINTTIASSVTGSNPEELLAENSITIHVMNTVLPPKAPENHISIYDSKLSITEKLTHAIKSFSDERESDNESEELTPREKLILKHVALGHTNKEIGTKLYISTHTVISHRKNITRKLDIKSVSGLTVYAILNGIIKMDDIS